MGNKTYDKFQWDKSFNVLQRNFNDHTLILEKKNNNQQYIGRELISTDKNQSQQIKRLIKIKYHNSNPFLTKLEEVYSNSEDAYCSPENKIYLVFLKPKQTLRQQILARKFANEPFTQQQADIILQSGAKAIRVLREMNHPHNNISTSSVFIDKDRKIILGDPWITPPAYNHGINQNVFACPSPEKILLQNDQILTICPYRSDLFSLGTVVLEALNYEHMDVLYEKGFRKLIESKVKQKLNKIKDEQLRYKLSIVLSHDPQNRQQIYRFYRTSSSTSQVKSKTIAKEQTEGKMRANSYNKGSPIAELSKQMLNYDRNISNQKAKVNYQLANRYEKPNLVNNPKSNFTVSNFPTHHYNPASLYSNKGYNTQYRQTPYKNEPNPSYGSNLNTNTNVDWKGVNNFNFHSGQYRINGTPSSTNPNSPNITFGKSTLNHNQFSRPINAITAMTNGLGPTATVNSPNLKFQPPKSQILPFSYPNKAPLDKNGVQNVMTDSHQNFEPILIKSSDQFVKTSGNIRYIDSEDAQLGRQKQPQSENIDTLNLAHTGNYALKPSYGTLTKTESYDIPLQQVDKKQHVDLENHLPVSNYPRKQEKQKQMSRDTPERKPNRKYNSTIKQEPDEYSYSGSRDGDDEYQYVIQTYEAGRYEGQKKNSMRNGFGKFYYKEGSVYEGNWRDNLMHGKGNLYYSDGKLAYEGDWRMDQFHGLGKVYNQEQLQLKGFYDYTDFGDVNDYWSSYEGELNSDRRHGKGKIKLSNGQIFVGNFIADTVEGEGKFYTLNGEIVQGIWRNNKLVKKV